MHGVGGKRAKQIQNKDYLSDLLDLHGTIDCRSEVAHLQQAYDISFGSSRQLLHYYCYDI